MPRRQLEIWTLDCETDPFRKDRAAPQPFIWGAYCKATDEYHTFGHVSLVISFFREKRACVYAHNGGRFDFHYMREGFESEQPLLIINGRIAKFKIGRCEFRDSFNILPVSLAAYQKENIDYGIFEPELRDLPENRAKIEAYLKSDCVNLAEMLHEFFIRFGRPLTQAGCAMAYYVKHYRGGVKPRQSSAQFQRYKPFYYGGRVECFKVGYAEKDFVVLDKNSAYPHAMLEEHPLSPDASSLMSDLPSDLERCLVGFRGLSRGALPYRLLNGELIFPRDREPRDYAVTGWELKAAIELGLVEIHKILEVYVWHETQNFKGYIDHFYTARQAARKTGDKAGVLFYKLLMNSCYGKFASDPSKYHDFMLADSARISAVAESGWQPYKEWGDGRWLLYQPQPVERHWYYNIATAASITGYVRAELLKDLHRTQGLLYCDTDSIAARAVTGLALGEGLGEWKKELDCDAYAIAGKKMYAFRSANDLYGLKKGEYKVACKGVDFTPAEIIRVAQGETLLFEPEVPTYSITRPRSVLIPRTVSATGKVQ